MSVLAPLLRPILRPVMRGIFDPADAVGDPSLTLDYNFLLNAGSTMAQAAVKGPVLVPTRSSNFWDFDENGLMAVAANDAPVFAHTIDAGVPLGLGSWETRTGLALWNRDLTKDTGGGGPWALSSVTTAKDATGIGGAANSASTITATGANGTALQTVTSASAQRAATAYVKRKTGTGAIEFTQDGGATWSDITASLSTSLWFRPVIIQTVTNPQVGFRIVTSGDEIIVDVVGLEAGGFETPPIPTGASSVVRAEDDYRTTDLSFINPAAMTWFLQVLSPTINTGGNRVAAHIESDAQAADKPSIVLLRSRGSGSNIDVVLEQDGEANSLMDITVGGEIANTVHKIAWATDAVTEATSFNGSIVDETWSVAFKADTGYDKMTIGSLDGIFIFNGYIQLADHWNVRKLNTFLDGETA